MMALASPTRHLHSSVNVTLTRASQRNLERRVTYLASGFAVIFHPLRCEAGHFVVDTISYSPFTIYCNAGCSHLAGWRDIYLVMEGALERLNYPHYIRDSDLNCYPRIMGVARGQVVIAARNSPIG